MFVKGLRFGLSIVGLPFTLNQGILSKRDITKYKPKGTMVDIGSRKLHAIVQGSGSPTVIFESGMGGCALDWSLVQEEVSKSATTISYDRLGYLISPLGIPRFLKMHIGSKRLPKETQKIVNALGYRNNAYKAVYLELLNAPESAKQLSSNSNIKADLPIIVLSAGKQDEEWKQQQAELLKLSRNTEQVEIEDSWHSIHIHKPEAVIHAIHEILNLTSM